MLSIVCLDTLFRSGKPKFGNSVATQTDQSSPDGGIVAISSTNTPGYPVTNDTVGTYSEIASSGNSTELLAEPRNTSENQEYQVLNRTTRDREPYANCVLPLRTYDRLQCIDSPRNMTSTRGVTNNPTGAPVACRYPTIYENRDQETIPSKY